MKRAWLAALCILAALICFSGCSDKTLVAGVFVYDQKDTFISELTDKIIDGKPTSVEMKKFYAERSQTAQNRQILELLEEDPALLIVNLVDRTAAAAVAAKCRVKNLPLIFFNREPLAGDMQNNAFYVGANAENQGRLQAVMAKNLFGNFAGTPYDRNGDGKIQIAVLKGEQGHQDAEKRTEFCLKQMREYGYETEVLTIRNADWERARAYDAMRDIYESCGEKVELLFANNDDMALGAIDYLKEKEIFVKSGEEYAQPFIIVGVDATENGLDAVREGFLYGTVLNDSTTQAAAILALSDCLMKSKNFSSFAYEITNDHYIYIDGKIVLKNNVSEFKKN